LARTGSIAGTQQFREFRAALHDFYQHVEAEPDNHSIECARGCSNCCAQMVYDVHSFEVADIGEHLAATGRGEATRRALRDREEAFLGVRRNVTRWAGESADDWQHRVAIAFFALEIPCVFLDAVGACSIHERRPYACRRFFSLSNPRLCTARGVSDPRYRGLVFEPSARVDALLRQCDALIGFDAETDRLDLALLRWFERGRLGAT
jgi:Fe-S-cluster containining protein